MVSSRRSFTVSLLAVLALGGQLCAARDCKQIDKCKCEFDDGSGTMDLSNLGRTDGTPLFKDKSGPDGQYLYSYNPCYGFDEGTCKDVAACQHQPGFYYYDIGQASTVVFTYYGDNVVGTYKDNGDPGRTSEVTFVCDPAATSPSIIVHGEVEMLKYAFTVTSSEICPKKKPHKGSCDKIDQCKCRFQDGSLVDLGSIGRQDGTPLFNNVPAPDGNLYSYNPCYPFSEDVCKDIALCQLVANFSLYYPIGDEKTNKFYSDGVNVFVRYQSTSQDIMRTSVVEFVCDQTATTPTMRALGEVATGEYIFTVISSAACPKPPPICNKVDNCRCNMSDGSGMVDLTKLAKQGGDSLLRDELGPDKRYEYSFNPCYPFTEGTCVNKSSCLLDISTGQYYDIGAPSVSFAFDGVDLTGTYTASDNVRASRVTFVCNQAADNATVDVLGELSPALYGFRVTSRHACLVKEVP